MTMAALMRLAVERPPPCPELEHRKADLSGALSRGWESLGEGTVDTCRVTGIAKMFYMYGTTIPIFIVVPLEDCTCWGEIWKAGEIMAAQAGEPPGTVYSCAEWPSYIRDQVKAEVLAPAIPVSWYYIAAGVGIGIVAAVVLARRL